MNNRPPDITLSKINEATLFVSCSTTILTEMSSYFSAFKEGYRFMPSFKAGRWDGKIRVLDTRTNQIGAGMLHQIQEFAKKGGYTLATKFKTDNVVDRDKLQAFIEKLNIPFPLRTFQFEAVYDAITNKYLNMSSVTGSGKSLIIYIICKLMQAKGLKTLVVVNSTQLVEQLYGDFFDYGMTDVEEQCCRIYAGKKRLIERSIIISTYQSLYAELKQGKTENYIDFEQIDCLLIDEAHGAKSTSIKYVCENAINAQYRFGCSGTFPPEKSAEWLTIVSGTGNVKVYSTYEQLQESGDISKIKVTSIKLSYSHNARLKNLQTNDKDFATETDYINGLEERNQFIIKLINSLSGNIVALFTKIDKHGAILEALGREHLQGKKVFYIDGNVSVKERENIRHYMEANDNCVLFGTYGVLAQGWNLKRLHNMIMCSGYKSRVKVLQSLGRTVRLHADKDSANLFDLYDDLKIQTECIGDHGQRWKKTYTNHSLNHGLERIKMYETEKFDIRHLTYNIKTKGD